MNNRLLLGGQGCDGFRFISEQTPGIRVRRPVPHCAFTAQWYHEARHGSEPCWTHGTGLGSDLEARGEVLSSAQRWWELSHNRALPCAEWAASWCLCTPLHWWSTAFPQWEPVPPCHLRLNILASGHPGGCLVTFSSGREGWTLQAKAAGR